MHIQGESMRVLRYALAIAVLPWLAHAQEAKAPYPKRLTGPELDAHFKDTWSADAQTSRASRVAIYNNSDGTIQLQAQNVGRASPAMGTRKIRSEEGQVCLDMGTTVWRGATDCYRVVQTDAQSYSMRSVTNKFRLDYRR
jgi:hypothetical protein